MSTTDLRLGRDELLTTQNAEFGGRKAVWVPHKDDEKSFVKAVVLGDGKKAGTKEVEFEGTKKDFKVKFFYVLFLKNSKAIQKNIK